jgi:hypothetical protein
LLPKFDYVQFFTVLSKLKSIIAVICVHLYLSAVNNEIEIIPACFLSAHALSMGWKRCVRAVPRVLLGAAGGGHGC